jgi:hypothetical protein
MYMIANSSSPFGRGVATLGATERETKKVLITEDLSLSDADALVSILTFALRNVRARARLIKQGITFFPCIFVNKIFGAQKSPHLLEASVVRPGLEPGLFWTKTRRVASYTIGQYLLLRTLIVLASVPEGVQR